MICRHIEHIQCYNCSLLQTDYTPHSKSRTSLYILVPSQRPCEFLDTGCSLLTLVRRQQVSREKEDDWNELSAYHLPAIHLTVYDWQVISAWSGLMSHVHFESTEQQLTSLQLKRSELGVQKNLLFSLEWPYPLVTYQDNKGCHHTIINCQKVFQCYFTDLNSRKTWS